MIEILWKDISKITDDKYQEYLSILPKCMQEDVNKYQRKEDRYRTLAGKILVHEYLNKYTQFTLKDIQKTVYGKPYILGTPFYFNLSHSGQYIVAIFSHSKQVGIDIEEIKDIEINDFKIVLSEHEYKQIKDASNTLESFYTLWTSKEAILKSEGRGLINTLTDIVLYKDEAFFEKICYSIQTFKKDRYIYTIAYPR